MGLSSWLDMDPTSAPPALLTTGSSGTAGESPGERTVTSGSFGRPPHSVAWTQKLLDTSARMAPDFPTYSMCAGCAGCSSRTPSPSEPIFSKQMFRTWNCKINNSVIQKKKKKNFFTQKKKKKKKKK